MKKRKWQMSLVAAVSVWAGSLSPALAAKPDKEQDPYPYGKAEFDAEAIKDVLALFRKAAQYRTLCVSMCNEKADFAEIERIGREAKNWYREVLEREPSNAYASLCIGYVDLTIGRTAAHDKSVRNNYLASALSRFREALEKRQGYADAYLYLAQAQALRGEFAEAEKNLRLILNSGIENSQIHSWMAYVQSGLGRKDVARQHVARAIELDNPSASAQWSRENQRAVAGGR